MLKTCITGLGLVAALFALDLLDVRGSELLPNGGFEDGTDGWSVAGDGQLQAVPSPVHSGSTAASFSTDQWQGAPRVYQLVPVQPQQEYDFEGWVFLSDPAVEKVFLRIFWLDSGSGVIGDSTSTAQLTGTVPEYRFISMVELSPPGTSSARVAVVVQPTGPFVIYLDDFSLQGPASPSPTAAPTPTPSPTAVPTGSPTLTRSPAVSATPGSTPAPTPAPTTSPTPAPTALPTTPATPPPSPTAPATPSPVLSRTPTHAPSPTPAASPTPTPAPPPPPSEPAVFTQLVNGGFEQRRADGSPYGWRKIGGTLSTVAGPVAEGSSAIALTSVTSATKWVYQTVSVQGGSWYEASVRAWKSDANAAAVFLRLSWYDTDDGAGESIGYADSTVSLSADVPAFRLLSTGPVQAPADARTAKIRLMLRPASAANAVAYFDDARFDETEPPPATPSPTATPAASVAATATPTPTSTTTPPTATTTATPGPEPAWEPDVFPQLTNGSFDDAREDGTPYAWRKVGGQTSVTDCETPDGLCLQLRSTSASTKWAYQTVPVQPGAYYEASVMARNDDPNVAAVFLRVSWYASADGDGEAIASADSNAVLDAPAPQFRPLTTGRIQAPAGAGAAKVKLMLRPASGGPASVLFDNATFVPVAGPDPAAADDGSAGADTPRPALAPGQAGRAAAAAGLTPTPAATALAAARTAVAGPAKLANVRPAPPAAGPAPSSPAGQGADWLLIFGIAAPLTTVLATGAAFGLVRGRSRGPGAPG